MIEALLFFLTLFCGIQVLYLLIVSSAVQLRPTNTQDRSVSVVIAAKNEQGNLPVLLLALEAQTHKNFEVIIINDRSTDSTMEILASYSTKSWLKVIHIHKLPEDWTGKKFALYKGIAEAKNDVLLFTDADCVPKTTDWINQMTNQVNKNIQIVLGYSPYQKLNGVLNSLIQYETILTALQYLGLAQLGHPYMSVGRNWAIARNSYPLDYLREIRSLEGGDDDLIVQKVSNSQNTAIRFSKESQTISIPNKSWDGLISQKVRHLKAGEHYSAISKTLLGVFSFSYAISWLIFIVLVFSQQWSTALFIYGIRSLSFYIIFIRSGQKLDTSLSKWALPLVEFCYPVWYTFLGLRSLAAKQIEWKPENSFLIKH